MLATSRADYLMRTPTCKKPKQKNKARIEINCKDKLKKLEEGSKKKKIKFKKRNQKENVNFIRSSKYKLKLNKAKTAKMAKTMTTDTLWHVRYKKSEKVKATTITQKNRLLF